MDKKEIAWVVKRRRTYGEHLTPIEIFKKHILPEIKDIFYKYIWVDLYAGEGNLILPILDFIPLKTRIDFFKQRIFLFDIQKELVEKSIENALKYGIPQEIARKNIIQRDTIRDYPKFLFSKNSAIYHITNPPYLYIGYISKNIDTLHYLEYFKNENSGYQDLYQLCLMNDLRNGIKEMIYIIPTNFLFGFSSANKIRDDFLKFYNIKKAVIFEKEIFDFTGTNVGIFFFERKKEPENSVISFEGIKINKITRRKFYILKPANHYRAGSEFGEFINDFKTNKPLKISYYLTKEEVDENKGDFQLEVIDANDFIGTKYSKKHIFVNKSLIHKIVNNKLFIRTVDTGNINGRAGLYTIQEVFGVDGILVTKARYRTHPIQVFIEPTLSPTVQILLRDYFNLVLEYFREEKDSEFLTTYKYSNSLYTRKYLGLSQTRQLIETFPILSISEVEKGDLYYLVKTKSVEELFNYLNKINKRRLGLWS